MVLLLAGCVFSRSSPPQRQAQLRGTLWWVSPEDLNRPIAAWRTELDQLEALGIRILVLNGPYVGGEPASVTADLLAGLFVEADRRGLSIYVDTLAAPNWWTLPDAAPEIARARGRIEALARRYGEHPSFAGWYLPYELYVMWDAPAELIATLYREISTICKQTTPTKAVMISPFFILDQAGYVGSFRWAAPSEYQKFWTALLAQSQVDIVAVQDSGEHLSFYTLEERRPFLAAMKAACESTHKEFWINIELGELGVESFSDYTNRFGYKTHVNDPRTAVAWRGITADKLRDKLRLTGEYSDTAISWGYQQFARPTLSPEAAQRYEVYRSVLTTRRHTEETR